MTEMTDFQEVSEHPPSKGFRGRVFDIGKREANHFLVLAKERYPIAQRGFAAALVGIKSVIRSDALHGPLKSFIGGYLSVTFALYGVFLALAFTILSPIFAILLFLSPGTSCFI
jgi:hypothetical protein